MKVCMHSSFAQYFLCGAIEKKSRKKRGGSFEIGIHTSVLLLVSTLNFLGSVYLDFWMNCFIFFEKWVRGEE